ncbi:hypothetical protein HDR58_01120 [bacterium]|nr:hypothetical protein [bacterium]
MKKLFTSFALLAFLVIPAQGAFAWTYDGLGSLNPFTGFGMRDKCGCKVERCQKQKLTKCEKLHGVKIKRGEPCGCAAPVVIEQPTCNNCQRVF